MSAWDIAQLVSFVGMLVLWVAWIAAGGLDL